MGAELAAGSLPEALARKARDAALQARQERRSNGRRWRRPAMRADESARRCSPPAARFRRRTTTISTASCRRRSRRGSAFRAWGDAAAGARAAAGADVRAFSIDDATHDRNRRRVLGARTRRTAISRSASTSRRRRSRFRAAARSMRSRASACRPSTCRAARSRCCPSAVIDAFTLAAGACAPGAVALRRDDARRRAAVARDRHATRDRRRQPAPGADRRGVRRSLPSPSDPPWTRRAARAVEASRSICRRARGKTDVRAHRLQLRRRLGRARRPRGDRAARRAASRSTSWSPS